MDAFMRERAHYGRTWSSSCTKEIVRKRTPRFRASPCAWRPPSFPSCVAEGELAMPRSGAFLFAVRFIDSGVCALEQKKGVPTWDTHRPFLGKPRTAEDRSP